MERRWIQVGGCAGVVGVAVSLATFSLLGSSPESSASATSIGDYVLHHQGRTTAVGVMVTVSAALIAWFVGTYSWVLHRNDRQTPLGFASLVTGGALVMLLIWDGLLDVAMSFLSHQASAAHSSTMTELYQLENGVVMPGAFGLIPAALLVAIAAAGWRGIAGGPVVGGVSAVLGVLSAAGGIIGLTTMNGGMSSPVSFAPAAGISVMTLVLGIGMLRHPPVDVVAADDGRREAAAATV